MYDREKAIRELKRSLEKAKNTPPSYDIFNSLPEYPTGGTVVMFVRRPAAEQEPGQEAQNGQGSD